MKIKLDNNPNEKELLSGLLKLIIIKLQKGKARKLSGDKLPYHNWKDHILPGVEVARELGEKAGIGEKEIVLLQIAYLYHDISLGLDDVMLEDHENKSVEIAQKDLLQMGLLDKDIEVITKLILGTKGKMVDGVYVYPPTEDELVKYIRDIDLAIIGSKEYPVMNERLRKEQGMEDKNEWKKGQIIFLSKFKFQTEAAEKLWGEQRKANLQKLISGEIVFEV